MEFNLPIEIETFLANLFANSHCPCHVINPKKTRVILWKEVKNNQEIYHLRIGLQRLISYACLDRNGDTYWRFETYKSEVKKEEKEVDSKAKDYEKPDSAEPAVNNSSTS